MCVFLSLISYLQSTSPDEFFTLIQQNLFTPLDEKRQVTSRNVIKIIPPGLSDITFDQEFESEVEERPLTLDEIKKQTSVAMKQASI